MLVTHAPAKLNLFFDVLRRLPDGYHEVESVVAPISRGDTVCVEAADVPGLDVSFPEDVTHGGGSGIPCDRSNLVCRAAQRLYELGRESKPQLHHVRIILQKRIPAGAGLGGGSSDAAATLRLLDRLWGLNLPEARLREVAARLGCDVPMFLGAMPVVCRGRGERLEVAPNGQALAKLHFVVAMPKNGLSTPAVYRACKPANGARTEFSVARLLDCWRAGDLPGLGAALFNRLAATAVELEPQVAGILEWFATCGDLCLGWSMTGSGSACFALCPDREAATRLKEMTEKQISGICFVAESSTAPCRIEEQPYDTSA